jgi:putative protein-disulfide isomerase
MIETSKIPDAKFVPTIVYANDPLCGWCFAIGPSLNQARENIGDDVHWRIECGGLVTGDRVKPIAMDRDYLKAGFAQVQSASGRVTGERYWSQVVVPGTWVLLVQQIKPEVAMSFSHSLTDALYLEGRTPEQPETLRLVADHYGLNADEFLSAWSSPDAIKMTQTAFERARKLGVTTYPSLFLEVGDRLLPILSGFATADEIEHKVRLTIQSLGIAER